MKKWNKICLVLGVFSLSIASFFYLNDKPNLKENFAFAENPSITIITLTRENILLGGAEYSITPDPIKMTGSLRIKDNSSLDSDKGKDGIITISAVKNGNYTITQLTSPAGYNVDKISKIIEVKDLSAVASFTNQPTSANSQSSTVRTITYTPKYVCGSVFGDEGPLRPGHYDTDISILNKQNFSLTILWNAVENDGPSSNAIIKNL
ncbi:MAG: prealbumin-like fold domain-containing protein, partial [Thaumarchaeota archaeon]|nr:prealbumin-like fold domain-containing protein [Nitrososphaerota archaeon]